MEGNVKTAFGMPQRMKMARELVKIAKELVAEADKVVLFDLNSDELDEKTASVSRVAVEQLWETKGTPSFTDAIRNIFLGFWNSFKGESKESRLEKSMAETNKVIENEAEKVLSMLDKHIGKMAGNDYSIEKGSGIKGGWAFVVTLKDNPLKCCKIGFSKNAVQTTVENGQVVSNGIKKKSISVSMTLPSGKRMKDNYVVGDDTVHDEEWFDRPSDCIKFLRDNFFEKDATKVL